MPGDGGQIRHAGAGVLWHLGGLLHLLTNTVGRAFFDLAHHAYQPACLSQRVFFPRVPIAGVHHRCARTHHPLQYRVCGGERLQLRRADGPAPQPDSPPGHAAGGVQGYVGHDWARSALVGHREKPPRQWRPLLGGGERHAHPRQRQTRGLHVGALSAHPRTSGCGRGAVRQGGAGACQRPPHLQAARGAGAPPGLARHLRAAAPAVPHPAAGIGFGGCIGCRGGACGSGHDGVGRRGGAVGLLCRSCRGLAGLVLPQRGLRDQPGG